MVFQPLEHLQAISYRRPPISALGLSKQLLDLLENAEVTSLLTDFCTFMLDDLPFMVLIRPTNIV